MRPRPAYVPTPPPGAGRQEPSSPPVVCVASSAGPREVVLARSPVGCFHRGFQGWGPAFGGPGKKGRGGAVTQLLRSASVLSGVLRASSQFILRQSRDVDAAAEDQKVPGACWGEVGWADPASVMAVQLLLRELALVVIHSLPRPRVETIPSTRPLCTRRGGCGNAADNPNCHGLGAVAYRDTLCTRLFSCRAVSYLVVAGV